jgi:hypothetical protein
MEAIYLIDQVPRCRRCGNPYPEDPEHDGYFVAICPRCFPPLAGPMTPRRQPEEPEPIELLKQECRTWQWTLHRLKLWSALESESPKELTAADLQGVVNRLADLAWEASMPENRPPERPRNVEALEDVGRFADAVLAWAERQGNAPATDGPGRRRPKRREAPRKNAARDAWLVKQRDKKRPLSLEALLAKLAEIAPACGWEVPQNSKSLSDAINRERRRIRLKEQAKEVSRS